MLRSTGFFRGIDCPFYAEQSPGSGGGRSGCHRPHCHFRHSGHRLVSSRAAHSTEGSAAPKDQGYDPFNPEVVHTAEVQNEQASASGDITGALALVNRAIEEVRTQMEREKRKLSRIGDEPYDPSDNSSLESTKTTPSAAHMTYDPGSYQMTTEEYNPSPSCSKYTLDTNAQENSANSMEYVPTLMKKSTRTQNLPVSPPKYSTNSASAKSKYTLDNTKPSTDMEYDPLSNYSASIAGKSKKDEPGGVKTESKSSRIPMSTEEYVVCVKKPMAASTDAKKYTISDSDGESSATEYKPTSISHLQLRKESVCVDLDEEKARTDCKQNALSHRNTEEDQVKRKSSPEKRELDSAKADKKASKETKKSVSSCGKSSSSSVDKSKVLKTSNHDSSKKENKTHVKKDGERSGDKMKSNTEAVREERQSHVKVKSSDRVKTEASLKRHRDAESGGSDCKRVKTSDKQETSRQHQNGLQISRKSHNDSRGSSSGSSKVDSSKDRLKSNSNSSSSSSSVKSSLKKSRQKERSLSLSHADLFGDESPEEAEPMEVNDDDDEEEERIVRKCANVVNRRSNKRRASERTEVSSEDEVDSEGHTAVTSVDAQQEVESLGIDLSGFHDDLDFESDPLEECLRIFNESNDVKKEDKGRQGKHVSRDSDEEKDADSTLTTLFPGQKKRVSHFVTKGNNAEAPPKAVVRPYKRLTAQEVCYQRMQVAQQQAAQLSAAVRASAQSHKTGATGEKKRIAHRPKPQTTPMKTDTPTKTGGGHCKTASTRVLSPSQNQTCVRSQTTAGIQSKTSSTVQQKRVAHTPTLKSASMKRPVIPTEFGAKVPTNVRQRYLNTFIDECVKFCASEQTAFQMALDEEKLVYERSSSKNIYLNVAVNTLKKLRSKSSPSPSPGSKPGAASHRKAQSHEEVLGGRLAATTSFTVNRTGKQTQRKLSGASLYHTLKAYMMTEDQLKEHGYPRKDPEASGRALLHNQEKKTSPADPFHKVCCRCGAEYKVHANGGCVRREECVFHWGRLRRHKVSGGWETSYSCCSGAVGALGCQVAKQHVQDGRKEALDGFVSTFSKPLPVDGNAGVFALDCEMCYTKQGLELTRVTVIDADLKVVYDTFVKPAAKVVDYNTRFSGVTEEDLEGVTVTLRDVQAVLLSLFSADSILLGHSLESDLLALKLIHSSVVDTAIVFPHRLGLPYKRALRNLMSDHLKRIIQDSVGGHDSSEDASACMELMMWKIREDAKVKR